MIHPLILLLKQYNSTHNTRFVAIGFKRDLHVKDQYSCELKLNNKSRRVLCNELEQMIRNGLVQI